MDENRYAHDAVSDSIKQIQPVIYWQLYVICRLSIDYR